MIETASWARRFLALFVDWIASSLVVVVFLGTDALAQGSVESFYVYIVYVIEAVGPKPPPTSPKTPSPARSHS